MPRSEEQPSNNDPEIKFAVVEPTAVEYRKNETRVEYTIFGNNERLVDMVQNGIEELSGGNVTELPSSKNRSSASHAMPGEKNWGAVWQPTGPNLSWKKPNQN